MPSSPSPRPATVLYDTEHLPSTPLDPPDLDAILRSKRSWKTTILALDLPRPVQILLTCLSITLSALQANGVYCWGTYGPVVIKSLGLDGTQGQTIVIGGVLGVYLMAAPLGSFTDRYGPRIGSLVSAGLSAVGYISFSTILTKASPETPYVHMYLTAAYFLIGAAMVGSYFAALTCASLSFPTFPTLSLSLPLSLIGLSPLFLTSLSSFPVFMSGTDLNPAKFLYFLGFLSPAINLFAFLFMRVIPQPLPDVHKSALQASGELGDGEEEPSSPIGQLLHLDEHTPLLIGGPEAAREDVEEGKNDNWGLNELVADWQGFWLFGVLLALVIGPGEMVLSSIGSILTSLLPSTISALSSSTDTNPLALRNKHVHLLSLASTVSRLVTGLLADYLSPPLTSLPNPKHRTDPSAPSHIFVRTKKVRLSRSAFIGLCSIILSAVFAYCVVGLEGEKGLSVLSGGVGSMYGALFTLTPAIVSHHFGPTNFGLAWGMLSYFAAVGSVVFSYLYAILSTPGTETECHGTHCFRVTFVVCGISCLIGGVGLTLLGRRWKV
ncbi:hypothetical protein IAR55_006624 [Kwoniella newhampshirensis]|uniref:NFD4 C-terminal domain-containing protein n=1 Tax=Kwoniella newhampshirensis TaxID=1651941 RepID=A0AAW0YEP1_9TREE